MIHAIVFGAFALLVLCRLGSAVAYLWEGDFSDLKQEDFERTPGDW